MKCNSVSCASSFFFIFHQNTKQIQTQERKNYTRYMLYILICLFTRSTYYHRNGAIDSLRNKIKARDQKYV